MKRIASPKALESTLENVPNYGMEEEKVKCFRTLDMMVCKAFNFRLEIFVFNPNL